MGAVSSSCCWGPTHEAEFPSKNSYNLDPGLLTTTNSASSEANSNFSFYPSSKTSLQFYDEITKGSTKVSVLLQDGAQLPCSLSFDSFSKALTINSNNKVRVIPHDDIKSILYGPEQLKRVETKAELLQDNSCVALHLKKSGNCIPIHFDSLEQKEDFINLMNQIQEYK